jgi:hypothetical protein
MECQRAHLQLTLNPKKLNPKPCSVISVAHSHLQEGRLNVQPYTGRYIPLPPCPPLDWNQHVQHCSSSLFHGIARRDMLRAEAWNAPVWRD